MSCLTNNKHIVDCMTLLSLLFHTYLAHHELESVVIIITIFIFDDMQQSHLLTWPRVRSCGPLRCLYRTPSKIDDLA